jgi:dipeptidyl aminopeptidase
MVRHCFVHIPFHTNIPTDSIYTERYMHTPEHNPSGYENSSVSDVEALSKSVRFLIMHGVADDNVHLQNTLVLIDKLDLANIDNYDMQVFPDSDHSIQFHMAHALVYERKSIYCTTPMRRLGYG